MRRRLGLPQYLGNFPLLAIVDGLNTVNAAYLRRALRCVADLIRAPQLRDASVGLRGKLYLPLIKEGRAAHLHALDPVFHGDTVGFMIPFLSAISAVSVAPGLNSARKQVRSFRLAADRVVKRLASSGSVFDGGHAGIACAR